MPHSLQLKNAALLLRDAALVGAQWRKSRHGDFAVLNPADQAELMRVSDGDAGLAQAAVDAAWVAFTAWRALTPGQRATHLRHWHACVIEHADDLARLISLEQGKPLKESRAEIAYGAAYIEWYAEEARRAYGDVLASPVLHRRLLVLKEPVGVVAAVTPWNFPMAMLARKLAPALAAGCTVVAKPAEDTPLSALALGALALEAGVPEGVINIVPASRARAAEVVDIWLDDTRVRKLSFTGSTAVGRMLARRSADTLKRVALELGGNAPLLVFEDADLDAAVAGAVHARFRNAGQTCISANRILVHAAVHAAFVERFIAAAGRLRCGPAHDPGSDFGPLIHGRAVERVRRLVDSALAAGARCRLGGQVQAADPFFPPTVIDAVRPDMALAREESFGPVAPILSFADEAEAIALANGVESGLAAYVYTRSLPRISRLFDAIEVGMLGINDTALSTELAPFGGTKASGYGREGSRYGLDEYLQLKYVAMGTGGA